MTNPGTAAPGYNPDVPEGIRRNGSFPTSNTREFDRVKSLKVVDWTR